MSASQSALRFAPVGTTAGILDIALDVGPSGQLCDLVWSNGDWALDTTCTTNMLVALGCNSRARPEDTLPDDGAAWIGGAGALLANLKQGWPGDALDALGRRTGSRLWLLSRAKQTEQTRKLAEGAASEALALVQTMLGISIQITVRWVRAGVLGLRAVSGPTVVNLTQSVAT